MAEISLGWHSVDGSAHEWFTSRAVVWKRIFNPKHLVAAHEPGDRLINGDTGKTANLVTDEKFGSFELYLEFMTARALTPVFIFMAYMKCRSSIALVTLARSW